MPRYILVHSTDSTNSYLNKMASILPSGTVIHTPNQTAGRGQRGNSWESEHGKNAIFSMLLKNPKIAIPQQFYISEAVSLAVIDALSQYADGFTIKWPNDIYHNNKKVCGILIEHSIMGQSINYSILGLGINVNQKQFLSDAPNPVSLSQILGNDVTVEEVLHKTCEAIERRCAFKNADTSYFEKLHREYLSHLYRNDGKEHSFALPNGTHFSAKIIEVEPSGMLILEDADGGKKQYAFKEVSFII